jgi:hypothetical protein
MGLPTFGADSVLRDVTLTVSSEDPAFPKANLKDERAFTIFKPLGIGSPVDIITDAGVGFTSRVNYLGLIFHDLFTQGASIAFASSPDAAVWTDIFTAVPGDNRVIFRSFGLVTARYFRLRVSGAAAPFSIGELNWGRKVEVPYGLPVGFDPNAEVLDLAYSVSQVGNILGSIYKFGTVRLALSWNHLPATFVEGTDVGEFRHFWDTWAGLGRPFFFCWAAGNPGASEKDAIFCVAEAGTPLTRPYNAPRQQGYRDLAFSVMALKE